METDHTYWLFFRYGPQQSYLLLQRLKTDLLLFHEQQSMRYRGSENIGIKQHYHSDDGAERHRVPGHESEDNSLIAHLLGGGRGNRNGLRVHHLPHHSTGAIGCAHQDRVDAELLRGNPLQTAKQCVSGCVAASECHSQPPQESAKERI